MELYDQGSLDRAYFGEFTFSIGRVFSEARERTSTHKFIFLLTFVIYLLIGYGLYQLLTILASELPPVPRSPFIPSLITDHPADLALVPLLYPLFTALIMMGIKQANDHKITLPDLFLHHAKIGSLLAASLLISLFVMVGLVLFILPGIYLMIAYVFTIPLILDKQLTVWDSMERSRRAVSTHWFRFLVFDTALIAMLFASAIPFGLGLIWTVPIAFISYGIVYRKIFGYSGKKRSA